MLFGRDEKSTFLIKSTKNNRFGTAFCIDINKEGSFFLTAAHVVRDCQEDALEIANKNVELIAIGEDKGIDLAVVFVQGLVALPLKLNKAGMFEGMEFGVKGFKAHLHNHKAETLEGEVKKVSRLKTQYQEIDIYELSLDADDNIERGYSGSAIMVDGYVFAVVVSRYNQTHVDAIPITYLENIWKELPLGLLEENSIEMISGTLEPQTFLGARVKSKKKPWLKYLSFLFLLILMTLFIREVPYIKEGNKLIRFDKEMIELYPRWEGIAKYPNNEVEEENIAQKAEKMATDMKNIDINYLGSVQNKSERYERMSYAYGIASHMYEDSGLKIKMAIASIEAGKEALKLMDDLATNPKRKNKINLTITMSYIIQVEEGKEELLQEAKSQYQGIRSWYHSKNNISNQIDVIDKFIKRLHEIEKALK